MPYALARQIAHVRYAVAALYVGGAAAAYEAYRLKTIHHDRVRRMDGDQRRRRNKGEH